MHKLTCALLLVAIPQAAAAQTVVLPGARACPHADARPEAEDQQRYTNCAWNYIAWDADSPVRETIQETIFWGRDTRHRIKVCGIPGLITGHCAWADVDVVYFDGGASISFDPDLPLLDIQLDDDATLNVPMSRIPKDISIRLTLPTGQQNTNSYSVIEHRFPETPDEGLAYGDEHIFHDPGFPPDYGEPDDNPPHGAAGHAHSILCTFGGVDIAH